MFDKHQKHIHRLTVIGQWQDDIFGRDEILVRSDIGGLTAQWLAGRRDFHARIEDAAGRCHVADFAQPRSGPVLGKMINHIGPDQPKPKVSRVAGDVEQDDLGQKLGDIERLNVTPRRYGVALKL